MKCDKCDSPLVFHRDKKELICHYCNRRVQPPEICVACNSDNLMYKGTGTEKVESELLRILPGARLARMDSDTMSKRGAHAKVLKEFRQHKLDIIIGTQMIAKGLDFPKVTQVGVVSADANLNLPDFRSGERTFNLITQVAGRAGRSDLGGEVIVQTYTPEHYAINFAARHDYHAFYAEEIKTRSELKFPPFVNIIKITLRSKKEENVARSASRLAERLSGKLPAVSIVGPAPAPMSRLRGFYRWNILLKTKDIGGLTKSLGVALKGFRAGSGVFTAIDVDPMTM